MVPYGNFTGGDSIVKEIEAWVPFTAGAVAFLKLQTLIHSIPPLKGHRYGMVCAMHANLSLTDAEMAEFAVQDAELADRERAEQEKQANLKRIHQARLVAAGKACKQQRACERDSLWIAINSSLCQAVCGSESSNGKATMCELQEGANAYCGIVRPLQDYPRPGQGQRKVCALPCPVLSAHTPICETLCEHRCARIGEQSNRG